MSLCLCLYVSEESFGLQIKHMGVIDLERVSETGKGKTRKDGKCQTVGKTT